MINCELAVIKRKGETAVVNLKKQETLCVVLSDKLSQENLSQDTQHPDKLNKEQLSQNKSSQDLSLIHI